jgi:hypothetical protein
MIWTNPVEGPCRGREPASTHGQLGLPKRSPIHEEPA